MSSTPTSDTSTKIGSDSSMSIEEEKISSQRAFERAERATTSQNILLFLVAFRIVNALSIRTFFQPDEFFQSLEPAWEIAFGKGSGAWITWEWQHQLRSAIHPTIFAAVYWLAATLSQLLRLAPDRHAGLMVAAPRTTQAVFAALVDYFTWKLGEKVYGHGSNEAWAALILTVCSPWQWFCSTRTLSNCLETTLTVVALNYWPWHWAVDKEDDERQDGYGLRNDQHDEGQGEELAKTLVIACSTVIDRFYYQQWTFPPFRFLYFNVAQSLSVFYGSNPWHYYLTQGYPLLLTTFLPFGIVGLYQSFRPLSYSARPPPLISRTVLYQLSTTALLVPSILSLISHKEVRFIYPLLPILHILSANPFTTFFLPTLTQSTPSTHAALTPRRLLLIGLALSSLALSILTTTAHQTAPLSVLSYLRTQYTTHYLSQPPFTSSLPPAPSVMTVGFLMPCHSTPWRSHLVFPGIKAWALGCEPPVNLNASARGAYVDEADRFYLDPLVFLDSELGRPQQAPRRSLFGLGSRGREALVNEAFSVAGSGSGSGDDRTKQIEPWDGGKGKKMWTEYIAFFGQLEPTMKMVLKGSVYRECWRGWNSWGHDDWRRKGDIIVWCARGRGREAGKMNKNGKREKEKLARGWW